MNRVLVTRAEFLEALRVFRPRRSNARTPGGGAALDFDGRFLSISMDDKTAVMHADGDWRGYALFGGAVLHALVMHPPSADPVAISYADGHLLIAGLSVECSWRLKRTKRPALDDMGLLDLLAMEQTASRVDARDSRLVSATKEKERILRLVSRHLRDLGVTPSEVESLVDSKIQARADFWIAAEQNSQG